jgi:hypothetical protein
MKLATNATRDPTLAGGGVFHSTDSMLTYHSGALSGLAASTATASRGRRMTISLSQRNSCASFFFASLRSRRASR